MKAKHGKPLDEADRRLLTLWAADCAERVLPHFEREHPNDDRPRKPIEAAGAGGAAILGWARRTLAAPPPAPSKLSASPSSRTLRPPPLRNASGSTSTFRNIFGQWYFSPEATSDKRSLGRRTALRIHRHAWRPGDLLTTEEQIRLAHCTSGRPSRARETGAA